jgi:hypothetical protein
MSKLCDFIEGLPEGYLCGGDNVHVNKEHLLVLLLGQKLSEGKDAFNSFLSQLHIRIENAFALLVRRWGILWHPLNVHLKNQPKQIKSISSSSIIIKLARRKDVLPSWVLLAFQPKCG